MTGKVIDVDFTEQKALSESDPAPKVSAFFEEFAELAETTAKPVERVSPEHAESLRAFAAASREAAVEAKNVETAWDKVKARAYELAEWAKKTRGNPIFRAPRRMKP